MKKLLTVVAVLAGIVICADAHAQNDWAGFSRFEQANREQPSAPKAVFMGNSITEGWIGKHPGFFSSNGYVSRGISGQTKPRKRLLGSSRERTTCIRRSW